MGTFGKPVFRDFLFLNAFFWKFLQVWYFDTHIGLFLKFSDKGLRVLFLTQKYEIRNQRLKNNKEPAWYFGSSDPFPYPKNENNCFIHWTNPLLCFNRRYVETAFNIFDVTGDGQVEAKVGICRYFGQFFNSDFCTGNFVFCFCFSHLIILYPVAWT